MSQKKKGRPIRDPNAPKKDKDPNKPEAKKGRPKGSQKPRPNGRSKKGPLERPSKRTIPKMSKRVTNIKLMPDEIEGYQKSQQPFLQPGVCYQIAPNLDHCLECASMKYPHWRARRQGKKEIDCRFFEFRKLV